MDGWDQEDIMIDAESLLKSIAIVLVLVTPRIWFEACRNHLRDKWHALLEDLDPNHDFGRQR